MRGTKFWGLVLSLVLAFVMVAPAYAGDRDPDAKLDLKGISPKHHHWLFSVIGGAAVGAGVGMLLGGAPSVTKGMLLGSGLMSDLYLMHNRNAGGAFRPWAVSASNTALGSGLGWTLCKCGDGAVAGALIGGGGTLAWEALGPNRRRTTASTQPNPGP